jgi:hypothetical protein
MAANDSLHVLPTHRAAPVLQMPLVAVVLGARLAAACVDGVAMQEAHDRLGIVADDARRLPIAATFHVFRVCRGCSKGRAILRKWRCRRCHHGGGRLRWCQHRRAGHSHIVIKHALIATGRTVQGWSIVTIIDLHEIQPFSASSSQPSMVYVLLFLRSRSDSRNRATKLSYKIQMPEHTSG